MRALLTAVLLATIAGCGTTLGDAIGIPRYPGQITEETSTFDGVRVISVEPGPASGCCSLGANWRSNAPDYVQIVVSAMGSYSSINSRSGLEFNIDGRLVRLDSTGHPTQFNYASGYRESTKTFVMRRADFNSMLTARTLRVRLNTSGGYSDGDLLEHANIPGAAIRGLRNFAARLPRSQQ